jgi:hypothetical protein
MEFGNWPYFGTAARRCVMEKVFTGEISKLLILAGVGAIGMSVLMSRAISKLGGSFRPYRKATVIYLLTALLFFGIIATTAYGLTYTNPIDFFILCQAYFFLIGILHLRTMPRYLNWSGNVGAFWAELLLTIVIALLGSILFIIIFRLFNREGMDYTMATSTLFFAVPFLFNHTFKKAIDIPPKVIKEWFYPVHEEVEEPDESKLKNLLVISFEFQKQSGDPHYTNFRAKAPTDMEFGQLFYYFINDYNERHPNNKIQVMHPSGEPQGWTFYKQPKWYTIITRYIEAEKTIFNNNIRENDVIICSRSL